MPANVAHTPRQQSTQTATSFLLADQPQLFRWSMQFLPSKDKLEIDKKGRERGKEIKRGKERGMGKGCLHAACIQKRANRIFLRENVASFVPCGELCRKMFERISLRVCVGAANCRERQGGRDVEGANHKCNLAATSTRIFLWALMKWDINWFPQLFSFSCKLHSKQAAIWQRERREWGAENYR